MNKKSHLLLANYLSSDVKSHILRLSFAGGCIFPDIAAITFLRKHKFSSRKDGIKNFLLSQKGKNHGLFFFFRLGICIHYTADCFSAPHSALPKMNIHSHYEYERKLENALTAYLHNKSFEIAKCEFPYSEFCNLYLEYEKQPFSPENDCKYIVRASNVIFSALL